jgi:gamma-glutamylputrescine oxidase
MCVEDVRWVLDYYRLSADGRLLFGGGTVYGGTDPADIKAKILPNLEKVFPQLRGVRVDFAWSGNCALSFSRVPQMGRLGPNVYYACGYSATASSAAPLRAHPRPGGGRRPDALRRLRGGALDAFPGRATLPRALLVLGSWWYGLRDRLGV